MGKEKKFWWKDEPEIGSYKFCHGGIWDFDFYIEEVAVKYQHMWEDERLRRFKGAKFVWGGCAGGWSYSDHPLKAYNVDAAKKEFEAWYEQYLAGRIENLKKALDSAQEDYERFLQYQKET